MLDGELNKIKLKIRKKSTVCKYVVPQGYGIKSIIGKKVIVDEKKIMNTDSRLFYASVNKENDFVTTTSSRSLAVVGISDSLSNAEKICEQALNYVQSDYIFIRHDIGTSKLIEQRIQHMNNLRGM